MLLHPQNLNCDPAHTQVNQLDIENADLSMLWLNSNERIVHPLRYNAGICGGSCGSTLPSGDNLRHSQIVHLLVHLEKFQDHQYKFTQCCAPVSYTPLQLLVRPLYRRGFYMVVVTNMIIRKCECLEVIDFDNKNSPVNRR